MLLANSPKHLIQYVHFCELSNGKVLCYMNLKFCIFNLSSYAFKIVKFSSIMKDKIRVANILTVNTYVYSLGKWDLGCWDWDLATGNGK
jgi:hypothetical protein